MVASGFEVKSKAPIDSLAANGMRLAFDTCGEVASWSAGTNRVAEIRPERPLCLGNLEAGQGSAVYVCCTTVPDSTVGYQTETGGGIQQTYSLEISGAGRSASIVGPRTQLPEAPGIGFLVGHGPLLVFSTWHGSGVGCLPWIGETCPDPAGQPLWRVPLPLVPDACATTFDGTPGAPCRKIAAGPVVPLAVDDTRIVVRRLDGALSVLDADGHELLSIPFAPNVTLTARIDEPDLVVLVAGQLRDYDARSGALLHAWPAPSALSLEDAAGGLAAYILHAKLHLLRLRDGADALVGTATSAQLENTGLFYAYKGAYPYPGRIRFVPFDQLP